MCIVLFDMYMDCLFLKVLTVYGRDVQEIKILIFSSVSLGGKIFKFFKELRLWLTALYFSTLWKLVISKSTSLVLLQSLASFEI